jgi:hypothetical protein
MTGWQEIEARRRRIKRQGRGKSTAALPQTRRTLCPHCLDVTTIFKKVRYLSEFAHTKPLGKLSGGRVKIAEQ